MDIERKIDKMIASLLPTKKTDHEENILVIKKLKKILCNLQNNHKTIWMKK